MGKRESVKKPRAARDWYPTVDPDAVEALKPFLYKTSHVWGQPAPLTRYVEPCAGDGSLIDLMHSRGLPTLCAKAYDIAPQMAGIVTKDCLTLTSEDVKGSHCFITNPPFSWTLLQPMLNHLPTLLPTWLLLPADMMHNKRMSPYIDFCSHIVSVGRLWWFKDESDKEVKGVDNFAWFCLDSTYEGHTKFYGRQL